MTGKRIPATSGRERIVVAGVTVKAQGSDPQAKLPPAELVVELLQGDSIIGPESITPGNGARAFARFVQLAPGVCEVRAYRRVDGKIVETAQPKSVTTVAGREVPVDLFLYPAPQLELVEAELTGDHGLLVPTPNEDLLIRKKEDFTSHFGDGVSAATKPFKPEYDASKIVHHPSDAATRWHPASYSKEGQIQVRLKLKAQIKAPYSYSLTRLSLSPTTGDRVSRGPFTFEDSTVRGLADNATFEVQLTASAKLPAVIDKLTPRLRLSAIANGTPMATRRPNHDWVVYVTWSKPRGRVEMHPNLTVKIPFPEAGPVQSITEHRLAWAVAAARGADTERAAMLELFRFVRDTKGIGFYGGRRYPTDKEQADGENPTEIDSIPPLHHYLWVTLNWQRSAQCVDLAGAFRLPARILGIGGKMDVETVYPWPPWDKTGQRRPLGTTKQPAQGSLKKRFKDGDSVCVFFDRAGFLNHYEGVLRWQEEGAGYGSLFAIGERVCEAHLLHPGLSVSEADERSASLFYQASDDDITTGQVKLAMTDKTGLRRPAFEFLDNQNQTLFMFHYRKSDSEEGDERQVTGLRLPKKK
ncbi:MAG: hypothetical protein DRI90_27610 [Deltaproteobacteria bacterium]|nr:MAG: hypothetical protein DRI90_27610 [Deltaproteobacteria bacterium]